MNRSTIVFALGVIACSAFLVVPLRAAQSPALDPGNEIVCGIGVAGVLDSHQLGFAFAQVRFPQEWHGIRPWVGLDVIAGGAFWIGGGIRYDIDIRDAWRVTLSSGPGYFNDGGVLPLGYDLEFVSTFEVSMKVGRTARAGLSFGHISNASLGHTNPGSELARVFFSMPIGR